MAEKILPPICNLLDTDSAASPFWAVAPVKDRRSGLRKMSPLIKFLVELIYQSIISRKISRGSPRTEKAADIGAFLLSSETTERIKQYRTDDQTASETTDWDTYLQRKWEITDRCLQDMISIAKKELKTDVGPKNIIRSLSLFRLRG